MGDVAELLVFTTVGHWSILTENYRVITRGNSGLMGFDSGCHHVGKFQSSTATIGFFGWNT